MKLVLFCPDVRAFFLTKHGARHAMSNFRTVIWSSVGKKLITGVTGFGLIGFILVHLLGNLTLLIGPEAFNHYAHFLESLFHGWFVYAFEVGLLAFLVFHIWAGLEVSVLTKYQARPVRYAKSADAGGRSRKTFSSVTMIITGAILFAFLIWHVKMFKYGGEQVIREAGGREIDDLYSVVLAAFQKPWIVALYVIVMISLGFHLRHATWSAFQSLGWANDRTLPALERIALVFSIIIAAAFCLLPLYMHFADLPAAGHAALTGGR
jgi:succinate dehydrogenase / fumarate reductase cytochrome b subunit